MLVLIRPWVVVSTIMLSVNLCSTYLTVACLLSGRVKVGVQYCLYLYINYEAIAIA